MGGLRNFRAGDFTTLWATNNTTTAVTAGTPGTFTGDRPENLAVLKADPEVGDSGTNKPGAAWTAGQYVVLGNGTEANWNGTAWVTGKRSAARTAKTATTSAPQEEPELVLPAE